MYIRGSGAIVVGFDVTNDATFEDCKRYVNELRASEYRCPVMVAVGNKIDLVEERKIKTEEAKEYFSSLDPPVPYFETSAKTGEGVNELFDSIIRLWLNSSASLPMNNNPEEVSSEEVNKKDKCVIC